MNTYLKSEQQKVDRLENFRKIQACLTLSSHLYIFLSLMRNVSERKLMEVLLRAWDVGCAAPAELPEVPLANGN